MPLITPKVAVKTVLRLRKLPGPGLLGQIAQTAAVTSFRAKLLSRWVMGLFEMKTFWKWACATAPRTCLVSTRMCIGSVAGSFYCLSPLCLGTEVSFGPLLSWELEGRDVCMSTDWSTPGSLWTARGCFIGRVTEPGNWLPGEVVESSSHTNITKSFPWYSRQSSHWRDWEGLSFTGKGFSTTKRHPKKPHIL